MEEGQVVIWAGKQKRGIDGPAGARRAIARKGAAVGRGLDLASSQRPGKKMLWFVVVEVVVAPRRWVREGPDPHA